MKHTVIRDYRPLFKFDHEIIACIGYFDGLHRGHRVLIDETIKKAKELNVESALITFDPDPWTVIHDKHHVNHITPIKEKMHLLEQTGLNHVITISFTKSLSKLTPMEFVESLLIPLNVKGLVCGEDFKFGYKGAGNVSFLQNQAHYYFTTYPMSLKENLEGKVGTTAITQNILNGDVSAAAAGLGRYYQISGFVVGGQHQGRRIGFPTANIQVMDEYVIPKQGVYAGYVEIDDKIYQSVVNIGHNPTFNTTEHVSIESFILDFDQDIYGKVIKQVFVKRLRDELKFDSIEALVVQMHDDVRVTREILDETTHKL